CASAMSSRRAGDTIWRGWASSRPTCWEGVCEGRRADDEGAAVTANGSATKGTAVTVRNSATKARLDVPAAGREKRGFARAGGDRVLDALRFVGEFAAVSVRGLVPGNWRRTMRAEFRFCLYQVGVRAIPVVMIAALLV